MLNKFIGIGMVGSKGAELRYTASGKAVTNFSLGMKRAFKNQQGETEWDNINVVVWGKQAEACAKYLSAKSMVAIDGRLQIDSYEKDGEKKWITKVVADNVRFLSPKGEGQDDFISGEIDEDPDALPF